MTALTLALTGGTVLAADGCGLRPATVVVSGGRIEAVLDPGAPLPLGCVEQSVTGCVVAPGFIDTHVHGGAGRNFMEVVGASRQSVGAGRQSVGAGRQAVGAITAYLAAGGVTACLATTTSAARSELESALAGLAAVITDAGQPPGARVLGIHLEGPYLNPRRGGAQRGDAIRPPDLDELAAFHHAAAGTLRIVTMAPEMPGAEAAIRWLVANGVHVSIGHTEATLAETRQGLAWGATRGTHLFNAMAPLHHRAPGPVAALLTDPTVYVELVGDGIHVDLALMTLVIQSVGHDRVVLISDGADVAGQGDGHYWRWEGTEAEVRDGRVVTGDGTIAGSSIRLDDAVRLLVQSGGIPLASALQMASLTPATSLGLAHCQGRLAPGYDADIVVLDANLGVAQTIVAGQTVYRSGGDSRL